MDHSCNPLFLCSGTMVKKLCFAAAALICGLLILLEARTDKAVGLPVHNPQRIASLAPAITETLYALGLGDRVCGVTQFCDWPPEASQKPKIGGFREVNLEAIARTGADLVILPKDMAHFQKSIEDLGIPVRLFNYESLPGFLEDMQAIGRICGHSSEAETLANAFAGATNPETGGDKPSVLFVLLNPDEYRKPVGEMTIIGADGFYNGIIAAAGGRNAYTDSTPFPRLSLEAVLSLDPDVIVIGAPEISDPETLAQRWRAIGQLKGTRGKRLLILNDPADTVPGPRSLATIRKIAEAVSASREGL